MSPVTAVGPVSPASRRPRSRPPGTATAALDLRLVPVALATWAVTFAGIHAPAWASAVLASSALLALLGHRVHRLAHDRIDRRPLFARTARPSAGGDAARPDAARGRHAGRRRETAPHSLHLVLLVVALAAAIVAVRVDLREDAVARLPGVGSAPVMVRITEDPRPSATAGFGGEERWVVRARLVSAEVRGRHHALDLPVTILAPGSWSDLAIGRTVTARVTVRPTERADDAAALLVTSRPPAPRSPPPAHLRVAGTLRDALRGNVADLPDHARALVPGIAVGDDRALAPRLEDDLRATGLTHLTAVSGAHVALVLAPVLLLSGVLRPGFRVGLCAAILLALVVLVRPEPSVVRAAAMGTVTIGAMLAGRPSAAPTSLSLTVTVLLLADPWLAAGYGFALSALATGALCLLAPVWTRGLARVMPTPLAAGIATTASAQLVCAPVLVLLEPRVSLAAVPANLLAAPAVAPVTFLGLGATLTGPVHGGLAQALARAAGVGTWWIAEVATRLAALPGATMPWVEGPAGALLLAAMSITVLLLAPRLGALSLDRAARTASGGAARLDGHVRRHRAGGFVPKDGRRAPWRAPLALAAAAAVLLAVVLRAPLPGLPRAAGEWDAIQCDVGQGAATLLRTGGRSAIALDVGPPAGSGRGETPTGGIARCVREAGITEVELLLLTHTHLDHAGGLEDLLGVAPVRAAVVGPGPRRAAVLGALSAQGASIHEAAAGTTLRAGGVRLDVLQGETVDSAGASEAEEDVNAHSLVVLATLAQGTTLLTAGDLGEADQDRLVRAARRATTEAPGSPLAALLDGVDVVSVPHHGSADQSADLAATLAPRLALVSVGENDYGHPTPEALRLYAGAVVRRTDECGDTRLVLGPVAEDRGAENPGGRAENDVSPLAVADGCS